MSAIEKERMLRFRGEQLNDSEGKQVGKVDEVYSSQEGGPPEWALVHTGLFGSKRTFVPLAGASEADGKLQVPLEKAKVSGAPHINPDGQLTKDEEAELYRHYEIEPPVGGDAEE